MLKETVERKELLISTEVEGKSREERMIRKDIGEGHKTGYRPGTLISDTVLLGYGSLP